jgi:hypothetical protein
LKPFNAKAGWTLPVYSLSSAVFSSGYIKIAFEKDNVVTDTSIPRPKKKQKAYSFYTKLPDGQQSCDTRAGLFHGGKFVLLTSVNQFIDVAIYRGLLQGKGLYIKSAILFGTKVSCPEDPVVHSDFDIEKCAAADENEQPFTVLLNLEGETPIDFFSLSKQATAKTPLGKKNERVFRNGDIGVFSWRQWHASGKPRSLPNIRIHFMIGSEDVIKPVGEDTVCIHPNEKNSKLSAEINRNGPAHYKHL